MFSKNNSAVRDFPEYTGETVNVIIASTPRCGSTLLGELLYRSQLAGYPHEYFHHLHAADFKERWGYENVNEYVALLKRWRASPNGVVSVKLHIHQKEEFGLDGSLMEQLFPGAKYIWIRREDVDNQAISLVKAEQTGQYATKHNEEALPAKYNFEAIRAQHQRLLVDERKWQEYFAENNIEPFIVWYNELAGNYQDVLKRIFDYLGFEHGPENIPDLPLKKMANDETKVWRFRYNRRLAADHPEEPYFVVTSRGWCGSHWLARNLNMHPDIVCCYGELNVPADHDDLTDEGLRHSVHTRQVARLSRGKKSIDQLMDEVMKFGGGQAYGSVHTLRLSDLQAINDRYPDQRKHYVMNMIRHPVSVVASADNQLRDIMQWDVHVMLEVYDSLREHIDYAVTLADTYELNLCKRDIAAFLAACCHQMHLGRDCCIAPDAPTIIMERVVSEKEYLAEVVRQLTNSKVVPDAAYLDKVFDSSQISPHGSGKLKMPSKQFAEWLPWQQEAFTHFFHVSELSTHYQKYGYDLSFVPAVLATTA